MPSTRKPARFAVLTLALFLGAVFAPPSAGDAGAAEIRAVRIGVHADVTRFVLESDERLPYKIFTLQNPYRIVIDTPEVTWKAASPRAPQSTGLIATYRYGVFQPGISRVVLPANVPVRVKSHFRLTPSAKSGHRIVLDLEETDPGRFAQDSAAMASPDWAAYVANRAMTPRPAAPKPAAPTDKRKVVVIDPGHGGPDPGGIGVSGVYEKVVVLKAAKIFKQMLEKTGRYRVVLTRDRDIYISLRKRYEVAEQVNADLFISLHADKIGRRDVRGLSVYTLSERASDKEAAALARKENKADIIAGADLSDYSADVSSILIDLAQNSTNEDSWGFAETLVGELKHDVRLLRNTHRFAGFAVLKSPNVPSVLVELGYLSNRRDEKLLTNPEYFRTVGRGLTKAIDRYFKNQETLSRT